MPKERPNCIRLLAEREFIGQHHRGGRPIQILLPIGAVGEWHPRAQCFTFSAYRRKDWNPYLWWSELQGDPDSWEVVPD